ncbi:hypothetical protein DES53_102180 [Roseimicrobium gellanilyticum]|uniref:Uncharacterized protein n=2 Tax=Roseimicrobium gellanilyticum TaxID=748857 RepID=A0A366HRT6_9BACT|nr:hypothetical protein DES53_102180 [Roseimicrobium gellanilyticum]
MFLLDRPTLGATWGSTSADESRVDGFYLGTYTPDKRQIVLRDSSLVTIPDAWIEHAWSAQLTLLLKDTKRRAEGHYFNIPIPRQPGSESAYFIELADPDEPVMYYTVPAGWQAEFDALPATVTVAVKEKKQGSDSWEDAITIDTIKFSRAF